MAAESVNNRLRNLGPRNALAMEAAVSAMVSGESESEPENEFANFQRRNAAVHEEEPDEELVRFNKLHRDSRDDLYDNNLDEEDEAYVYKNLRGGIHESVAVLPDAQSSLSASNDPASVHHQGQRKSMRAYKPRNSDAVLSCPSCFNIVCMDCQRHQKFLNQFRAMFVMGIHVDWQSRLIYDEEEEGLVPKPRYEEVVEPDHVESLHPSLTYKPGEYFPVLCANCDAQVAALDMTEEIYHFHGCLESS